MNFENLNNTIKQKVILNKKLLTLSDSIVFFLLKKFLKPLKMVEKFLFVVMEDQLQTHNIFLQSF